MNFHKHKKLLVVTIASLLLFGGMIGGTVAWLTDTTKPLTNTFTDSDVEVTLTENKKDFKMIPGWAIDKDPVVTVKAGSEDCFVFLKVTESTDPKLSDYITYCIDKNNWESLAGENGEVISGIYYCEVTKVTADRMIKVLGYESVENGETVYHNNQVLVKDTVTKEMMDEIDGESEAKPTLTFNAYAVQMYKNNTDKFEPYEAWQKVSATVTTTSSQTP